MIKMILEEQRKSFGSLKEDIGAMKYRLENLETKIDEKFKHVDEKIDEKFKLVDRMFECVGDFRKVAEDNHTNLSNKVDRETTDLKASILRIDGMLVRLTDAQGQGGVHDAPREGPPA